MNHTLHIPALEADCWEERDPGDEHQNTAGNQGMARSHKPLPAGSSPAPATTFAEVLEPHEKPRVNAARFLHTQGDVLLAVHDRAGTDPLHSVVLFFTPQMASALIEQAIEALDDAETFAQQQALTQAHQMADYREAAGRG